MVLCLTARRPRLGAVLAKPTCQRLFAAQTTFRWGDTFNTVALVVLVFRRSAWALDHWRGHRSAAAGPPGQHLTPAGAGVRAPTATWPGRRGPVQHPQPGDRHGALAAYGVGTSTGMVTYNALLQAEVARGCVGGCSPASICCARPAGWPHSRSAASRPTPWDPRGVLPRWPVAAGGWHDRICRAAATRYLGPRRQPHCSLTDQGRLHVGQISSSKPNFGYGNDPSRKRSGRR
jgi:hypothetical protein